MMVRIQTSLPECLIKCRHANMTACVSRFSCICTGLLFITMCSCVHAVRLDVRGNGQGRGPSGGVGWASIRICLTSERERGREGGLLPDSKCKRMNTNDRRDVGETWGGRVIVWGWGGVLCGWRGRREGPRNRPWLRKQWCSQDRWTVTVFLHRAHIDRYTLCVMNDYTGVSSDQAFRSHKSHSRSTSVQCNSMRIPNFTSSLRNYGCSHQWGQSCDQNSAFPH